ncbi:MAG: TldD/PmbA family protein [Lutisporaceae bacterium]
MFKFSKKYYTDVRIEYVNETKIEFLNGSLESKKTKDYKGAFIRVFDGTRWYYSATTELDMIQSEIDMLNKLATINNDINNNLIVSKFEVNVGKFMKFCNKDVALIPIEQKETLLRKYFQIVEENKHINMWRIIYTDINKTKKIYSSKGTNLTFDYQSVGIAVLFSMSEDNKKFDGAYQKTSNYFDELLFLEHDLQQYLNKSEYFFKNAVKVKPNKYTVVFAPEGTGVFAHESFGHKSESDFMVGDEVMKSEWELGKKVASEIVSIIDNGDVNGRGYIQFDDEGTKCKENYLIENGILKKRLHSCSTAALLGEELTGNARAVNFEYEPIVRMTTTYIKQGNVTKEQLIEEVDEGVFVENVKRGAGMSIFTINPQICYMIRNGKIAEPVNVSVVTGSVFEALQAIDGISQDFNIHASATGGCRKMEQYPLPVGYGGPYIRVRNMNVW